jgi:hypothetical protein
MIFAGWLIGVKNVVIKVRVAYIPEKTIPSEDSHLKTYPQTSTLDYSLLVT